MAAEDMGAGRGSRQRRALNMIWTAAGDYSLSPGFVAYLKDGRPDLYFNTIMGLAYRRYGSQGLDEYLLELGHSMMGAVLVDMFWLGLEHMMYTAYGEELLSLEQLRRLWAEDYLDDSQEDSMQHLMMRQELAHSLKKARCLEVLRGTGKHGLLNPWEKSLYQKLYFADAMTMEELKEYFRQVVKKYFLFSPQVILKPSRWHLMLGARFSQLLRRMMPLEQRGCGLDMMPELKAKAQQQEPDKEPTLELPGLRQESAAKELAEIKAQFPRALMGEVQRLEIEQQVCVDNHRYCHVYFARGQAEALSGGKTSKGSKGMDAGSKTDNLHEKPMEEASGAYRENYGHYCSQGRKYRMATDRLAHGLQNSLQLAKSSYDVRASQGRLAPAYVWQAMATGDDRVFQRQSAEAFDSFSVVILLDGSYSRHEQQQQISSQCHVIAESMRRCQIPVEVLSYCTIGHYTVLQVLKGIREDSRGIFGYEARGWNRDGLALRSLGAYLKQQNMAHVLLFILSDMMPSDEQGLPMAGLKTLRQYSEKAALEDTVEGLQQLRKQGVAVSGIIQTVVPFNPATAQKLFGKSYVHIDSLGKLSGAIISIVDEYVQGHI